MVPGKKKPETPTVIKKYANRRLYDTGRSSYVTLDDLAEMVRDGYDFIVYDAKSGEDLTRPVLTQIIVEQESRGQNLLPVSFLRQLIGMYGDRIQQVVPNYLEYMMDAFTKNQERFQEQVNSSFEASKQGIKSFEGLFPAVPGLEEVKRQNMAMFEKTMKALTPFSLPPGLSPSSPHAGKSDSKADKIRALRQSLAEIEKEIKRLSAS